MPVAGPVLVVDGLNAFYGRAHALEDVGFEMGRESVAIVGRNGMGKTTLCNAIMGIRPPEVSGSIRFEGQELVGRASYRIAAGGIGYVPQEIGRASCRERVEVAEVEGWGNRKGEVGEVR